MTFEKNIPNATAKRLSLYYRIFKRFHRENIDKASSKQIAEAIGIDPATVRRDFSYFGELGRRGFGYDVSKLMTFFAELLNDNATTKVVLVGVGNIGRALLHYRFQERNRMQLVMAFDTDDNELVLNLPRHVVLQYVDLTSELQTLLYFMKEEEKARRNND